MKRGRRTHLERCLETRRESLQDKANLHALGHIRHALGDKHAPLRNQIRHRAPGDFEPALRGKSVIPHPRHARPQLPRIQAPFLRPNNRPIEVKVAEEGGALARVVPLKPVLEEGCFGAHEASAKLGGTREGEAEDPVPDLVGAALGVEVGRARRVGGEGQVLFEVRGEGGRELGGGEGAVRQGLEVGEDAQAR